MNLRIFISIIVISTLTLAFNNCTGASQEVAFSLDSKLASNGDTDSGQPYDGKVYIVASNLCRDGIQIKSRIVFSSPTTAKLDRDNCEYIPAVNIASSELTIDPASPNQLIYKSVTFQETARLSQGISNFTTSGDLSTVTYSFDYLGTPNYLQVLLDTDNSFATGYNYSGDVGADYLLENGELFVYSGNGGAWGWTRVEAASHSTTGGHALWTIPRTSISSPSRINAKARTSLGYSTGVVSQ